MTYTDGTTSTFDAVFSDWTLGAGANPPVAGNTTAVRTTYRNVTGNQQDPVRTYVFSVTATLTAGKTVAGVTLPNPSGGDAHVFAIGFAGVTAASSQAKVSVPHIPSAPKVKPAPGHVLPPSRERR